MKHNNQIKTPCVKKKGGISGKNNTKIISETYCG